MFGLKESIDDLLAAFNKAKDTFKEIIEQNNQTISQLQSENERLIEVVKFYGNPQTYKDTIEFSAPITDDMTTGPEDFGHKARELLKELGVK